MPEAFFIAALIAVLATILTITRSHPVHALLYLILSLLAVAFIFYLLGAPFVAALEVITYAGAIMVLFVFVVMLLNPGPQAVQQERSGQHPSGWIWAVVLSAILLAELLWSIHHSGLPRPARATAAVSPQQLSLALYGPYLLGVEMASVLLLSALVGAWHVGRQHLRKGKNHAFQSRAASPRSGRDSVLTRTDQSSRAS